MKELIIIENIQSFNGHFQILDFVVFTCKDCVPSHIIFEKPINIKE
jgi:hypothetical protein